MPRLLRLPQRTVGPNRRRRTELGLLIFVAVLVTFLYLIASFATQSRIPPHIGVFLGLLFGLLLVGHVGNRFLAPNSDPVLLPLVFLLNGLGYVVIARWDPGSAKVQAGWTGLGILAYLLILFFVRTSRSLERYRYLLLLIGGILLVTPLVPGLGREVNGARLWIGIGSTVVQPIEIAKLLICIYFASYLASHKEVLSIPTLRVRNRLLFDPAPLVPVLIAWVATTAIIGAENDIAFALLLFTLFIGMLWVTSGRHLYIALGLGLFAAASVVANRLFPQVHIRFQIWFDAFKYSNGHGYQLVQSWFALANGGLGGTGLGRGISGHALNGFIVTDLVFTGIGEELGFIGAAAVVIAFVLIIGCGFRVAQAARSDFSRLLATGLTLIIGFQAFFVMSGILRLLPFTGITLPFVAYGGSSLIANYALIAVIMRISDEGALRVDELRLGLRKPSENVLVPAQ